MHHILKTIATFLIMTELLACTNKYYFTRSMIAVLTKIFQIDLLIK